MSGSNNSMSKQLAEMLRLNNNVLEFFTKYQDVLNGTKEVVTISYSDSDGNTKTVEVPSLGYLRNQYTRLAETVNALSGGSDTDVTIRMPDGSYKKLYSTQYRTAPARITTVTTPGKFQRKSNYFYENLYNPLLFVAFDVSSQVGPDAERAVVKKMILTLDTEEKVRLFDTALNGRNDLEYEDVVIFLTQRGITWQIDEEIVDLPVAVARYSGDFDVISITDVSETDAVTGDVTLLREYRLHKIVYTDNVGSPIKDSMTLRVGDILLRGENTKYEVVKVDASRRCVVLKRVTGMEPVPVGVGVLSIFSDLYSSKEIQVPIAKDHRQIIFLKAIDANFEVAANRWSPGTAFASNDLSIDTPSGRMSFLDYYHSEVLDYSLGLNMLAKERVIPTMDGLPPAAPSLSEDNFQVKRINDHKFDNPDTAKLTEADQKRVEVKSRLEHIDKRLAEDKERLYNTKFSSDDEKKAIEAHIDTLLKQRDNFIAQYKTIVDEMTTLAKSASVGADKPKFRVRGFWPIPQARHTDRTGSQQVVQFVVSYRYLRLDGNASNVASFDFVDNDGNTVRGYFTNWVETKTDSRKREYDYTTGQYMWSDEDVTDPEMVNINQLDIPITPGEKVEIRVKAVSEAGWHAGNPLMSDWSNSVTIDFPESLLTNDETDNAIKDLDKEATRVSLIDELASRNLDRHLNSSRTIGDKYYAHDATDISSGFHSAAGTAQSVYEALSEMKSEIERLRSLIEKAKGTLAISIMDEAGQVYKISTGDTVDLFAGYYSEIVASLPASERKGAIVTKVYTILVENSAASALDLISRLPGGADADLPSTADQTWQGMPFLDTDYLISRKYDKVPISYNSISTSNAKLGSKVQAPPFQSSQLLSQFLYLRHTDVGLKRPLYATPADIYTTDVPSRWLAPTTPVPGSSSFVWNGKYDSNTLKALGNGTLSDFCIHKDHPALKSSKTIRDLNLPLQETTGGEQALYSAIRHSYFFNLDAYDQYGTYQLEYTKPDTYNAPSTYPTHLAQFPDKLGFYAEDRYLIGSKTCGSYLYLAPSDASHIAVAGSDYRAKYTLEFGEGHRIKLPVIFQFRMTDYYGDSETGSGVVGGHRTDGVAVTNPTYSKRIGMDIYVQNESPFSFDVQVTARYQKESLGSVALPGGQVVVRRRDDLPTISINGN